MKFLSFSIATLATLATFFSTISSAVLPTTAALATRDSDLAARDYATGACGMHVTLYTQTGLMYSSQFAVEVTLKDANHVQIGHLDRIELSPSVSVDSQLPFTMEVARYIDKNSLGMTHITFAYGTDKWANIDTSRCTMGGTAQTPGYLVNDMDCGFAC